MQEENLKNFVKLTRGINQTRSKGTEGLKGTEKYDQLSFEADLLKATEPLNGATCQEGVKTSPKIICGEVVINLMKSSAVIVSSENEGKVLSTNFLKVDFLNDSLDKRYFIYLFNENSQISKQKNREIQGLTLNSSLSIQSIERLRIPLLKRNEQELIGLSYMQMLVVKKNYLQMIKETEKLTLAVLEKKTKGVGNDEKREK